MDNFPLHSIENAIFAHFTKVIYMFDVPKKLVLINTL